MQGNNNGQQARSLGLLFFAILALVAFRPPAADAVGLRGRPMISSVSPKQGSKQGGTVVTISGAGFTDARFIKFGPNSSTRNFTLNSDSSITATSPKGAGTVDIQVVVNEGAAEQKSEVTTADQFTFTGPLISSVSPKQGSARGGTVVTISGAGFTGTRFLKFGPNSSTRNFTVNNDGSITATSPKGSGTVDIQVVVNEGAAELKSEVTAADQFTFTGK